MKNLNQAGAYVPDGCEIEKIWDRTLSKKHDVSNSCTGLTQPDSEDTKMDRSTKKR